MLAMDAEHASHIVSIYDPEKIQVRVGEWDFSTTSEVHPHVERKVRREDGFAAGIAVVSQPCRCCLNWAVVFFFFKCVR